MAPADPPRITAQMLLLGRGVRALAPGRRLVVDVVGLLLTLAVLAAVAVVLDVERSAAVPFVAAFVGLQVLGALARYVLAERP